MRRLSFVLAATAAAGLAGLAAVPLGAQAPGIVAPPPAPACAQAPDELCDAGRVFAADEVRDRLGERDRAWWIEDGALQQVQRAPAPPTVCCFGPSFPLHAVAGASDLWAISLRAPRLDEAVLTLPGAGRGLRVWRGSKAPPPPPTANPPPEWLSTVETPSRILGGPTRLYVYSPPHKAGTMPVIYVADGESVDGLANLVHGLAQAGLAPEVMLIGVVPEGRGVNVLGPDGRLIAAPAEQQRRANDLRAQDYLLGFPGGETRFAAHEQVLLKEVLPYAERALGAPKAAALRGVLGWSNGGCWAFEMAARHPEVFGTAIALSCGGGPPVDSLKGAKAHQLFAGAGLYEPGFLRGTRQGAANLTADRKQMQVRVGGHDQAVWNDQVAQALPWAFGAAANSPPT